MPTIVDQRSTLMSSPKEVLWVKWKNGYTNYGLPPTCAVGDYFCGNVYYNSFNLSTSITGYILGMFSNKHVFYRILFDNII